MQSVVNCTAAVSHEYQKYTYTKTVHKLEKSSLAIALTSLPTFI